MPVLPGATPNINSAVVGSWNAYDLVQLVAQRIPGYQLVEYLREINDAYQEMWKETQLLDNDYFTAITQVTVTAQSQVFDLRYNQGGLLSAVVHPRLYQPIRVRVLPVNGADWNRSDPCAFSDDANMASEENAAQPASTTGPYRWQYFNRGLLRFARPLPVGTTIEIIYSYSFFELNVLGNGTIQIAGISGSNVTGAATTFTQLLPPMFNSGGYFPALPLTSTFGNTPLQIPVEADLIVNPATTPLSYPVNVLTNDTTLTIYPATSGFAALTPYVLATVPDIPEPHRRTIATLATRNMLASPAIVQDARFAYWDAKAERDIARYKDSITERQQQGVDKRQRFPLSMTRRGWSTGVQ